jgi:hypothetical protein
MSKKTTWRLDAGLKAKVALEVLRNEATVAELRRSISLTTRGRSSSSTVRRRFSPAGATMWSWVSGRPLVTARRPQH